MKAQAGLDFTSALFLGMRHERRSLPNWTSLTTGVPAGWRESPAARLVAGQTARSQGAQGGFVARSALHALVDVMTVVPRGNDVIAIDEATYPIANTAALLARGRGVQVRTYTHHRPEALSLGGTGKVIYVTDGWCQGCNQPAPLPRLQEMAARAGGLVVIDDSLACGILGHRTTLTSFGDGTGTPRWFGMDHERLLWVASFAKAHGAPLAVVTGDDALITRLARDGNREHSSPPTAADLAAATAALDGSRRLETRRRVLREHVSSVRRALLQQGLPVVGMPFPLVAVWFTDAKAALCWLKVLQQQGIYVLVVRPRCRPGALLTVALRSEHTDRDIARLVDSLGQIVAGGEAAC